MRIRSCCEMDAACRDNCMRFKMGSSTSRKYRPAECCGSIAKRSPALTSAASTEMNPRIRKHKPGGRAAFENDRLWLSLTSSGATLVSMSNRDRMSISGPPAKSDGEPIVARGLTVNDIHRMIQAVRCRIARARRLSAASATRMRSAGRLFLGINDDYLQDNTGYFRVIVYY